MNIIPIVVGSFQVNCYVVGGTEGRCLVIDPGEDAGAISAVLRQNNLKPSAYLITHGHMDHVGALAELTETFPAPYLMHSADAAWAFTSENQMLPYYDSPARPATAHLATTDGATHTEAGLHFTVLSTPGHSPGCICFHFPGDKVLFTGDTLFSGSVGRTDLDGGDERLLVQSLARLAALPDDTAIYPGHGPRTTLGREKRVNPFMKSR